MTILYLLGGFVSLLVGAKLLVHSSSKIASLLGMAPLVVGLTVVAFGTNSPELLVSIQSSLLGKGDIAIGNVIGSNIFNILGVLGLSALLRPLKVCQSLYSTDVPIMIVISLLLLLFVIPGKISVTMGALLIGGVIGYTYWTVVHSKDSPAIVKEEYESEYPKDTKRSISHILIELVLIVIGLVFLIYGSEWFVKGATQIAKELGVSELLIGLTIVSIGSSLPELATSLYATWKKEYDIAVGNMIGSNIFNILGVLGIASVVHPGGLTFAPSLLDLDVPLMVIASCLVVPLRTRATSVGRIKGLFLILVYCGYITYLVAYPTSVGSLYVTLSAVAVAIATLSLLLFRRIAR